MITEATRLDLGSCPFMSPVESWDRARRQIINWGRLIEGVPCYYEQDQRFHIEQRTRLRGPSNQPPGCRRMTGRHDERITRFLYYPWREHHPQIIALTMQAEVLTDDPETGLVIRVVKRGYPERRVDLEDHRCWDLEEIRYRIEPGLINRYWNDIPAVSRAPLDPTEPGYAPGAVSGVALGDVCERSRAFTFKYDSHRFDIEGLRVGHRLYRTGARAREGGVRSEID